MRGVSAEMECPYCGGELYYEDDEVTGTGWVCLDCVGMYGDEDDRDDDESGWWYAGYSYPEFTRWGHVKSLYGRWKNRNRKPSADDIPF